jgi:hypothetical protein
MLQEHNQAEQLSLLSPAELAELEVEVGLSPTWMQEEEMASGAGRGVRRPPLSEARMHQEQLPGLTWK